MFRQYTEEEIAIAAQELLSRQEAEESLYEFTRQAWPHVAGNIPFVGGWHMEIIAKCLECAFRREHLDVLINIPPGMSKTTLISVMFPAWCWIHNPEETFMCASYASSISLDQSLICRRLIESVWFQLRWGNRVKLAKDQNAKGLFYNDRFGYRLSTSVGGVGTGMRGGIKIADDPNDVNDSMSEVKLAAAKSWWNQVWPSRSKDFKKAVRIVVQQRTSMSDISGVILDSEFSESWMKIILPMEFEPSNRCKIKFPNGEIWEDPRTKEGELLCEERFGADEIKKFQSQLGAYGYAGQYQQRPSPEAGGIIKREWFSLWDKITPPDIEYTIQSWDTAIEAHEMNCYSACTTWGIFDIPNTHNVKGLILLSLWRGRVEFPELRTMAQRLYNDYRDDGEISLKPDGKHRPNMVLIEAKASGNSLVQEMMRAGIPAIRFNPTKYGDKLQRVRLTTHLLECGRVYIPGKPPLYKTPRNFAEILVQDCINFPFGNSRDLIDTMTQVLIRMSSSGWLVHPSDEDRSDTSVRMKTPIYGRE
jgi:hypothetical protein